MRLNLQTKMVKDGFIVDCSALDQFWKMIYTRHLIWYKRFMLKQPAPWTKNPVFLQYKFTNMYRELDRGTIYLLDSIIDEVGGRTPAEQVFNIILYRMFNRIATYDHVGFQTLVETRGNYTWPAFRATFDKLRAYAKDGGTLYTDAHMVCAYEHFPGRDKLERFEHIFKFVLKMLPAIMHQVTYAGSLSFVHHELTRVPGIGPFIGYEVAVDISYAPWNNHTEDEWVNPGPGCQRGLKRIFANMKPKECAKAIHTIRDFQEDEWERLGLRFQDIAYKGRRLTLRNVEHDLCEYFKYNKAIEGKGRPRNKFKAQTVAPQDMKRLKG